MSRRMLVGVTTLLLGATALLPTPVAASSHYTVSDVTIESGDGTMLTGRLYRPTGYDETPVIAVITPYGTPHAADGFEGPDVQGVSLPTYLVDDAIHAGYSFLQVNLRGFHGSEGCGDLGGEGEQMDAEAAIEWAASQPWSTGKVGTIGHSYEGFSQVMALGEEADGHAAAVITGPLTSGYKMFFMNGVHYNGQWKVMSQFFGGLDLVSPSAPGEGDAECYAANAFETLNPDPASPFWQERDLVEAARQSDVPTFWGIGLLDANTKPDNFLDVYSGLSGPKRAWLGQWEHGGPASTGRVEDGAPAYRAEVMRFFDLHLKGSAGASVDPAVEVEQGPDGVWRSEPQWPPADSTSLELPVNEGAYVDSVADDAGGPSDWLNLSAGRGEEDASKVGTWTFSQELPYDVHLSGTPRLDVLVDSPTGGVHVHARLFDVDPSAEPACLVILSGDCLGSTGDQNAASIITRGAALAGTPNGPALSAEPVSFDLYPQDYVIAKGHRIGLLLSGADNEMFDPGTTGATVRVRGTFDVPFLRFLRTSDLEHVPGVEMMRRAVSLTDEVIQQQQVVMPLPPQMTTP